LCGGMRHLFCAAGIYPPACQQLFGSRVLYRLARWSLQKAGSQSGVLSVRQRLLYVALGAPSAWLWFACTGLMNTKQTLTFDQGFEGSCQLHTTNRELHWLPAVFLFQLVGVAVRCCAFVEPSACPACEVAHIGNAVNVPMQLTLLCTGVLHEHLNSSAVRGLSVLPI
jgi:hypothetical protein